MTALTKTLELKLVAPNAHKRWKLCETRESSQQALQDAFDARCPTQSETNDIVVNYDLSGYAKNALTKYVSQLTTTYNADELHDDHPVRFTNEGLRLDHKPDNTIEWDVTIAHHEDYHLWMPARIPNSGTGWKRCTWATRRWVRVGCSSETGRGSSTSLPPAT